MVRPTSMQVQGRMGNLGAEGTDWQQLGPHRIGANPEESPAKIGAFRCGHAIECRFRAPW